MLVAQAWFYRALVGSTVIKQLRSSAQLACVKQLPAPHNATQVIKGIMEVREVAVPACMIGLAHDS